MKINILKKQITFSVILMFLLMMAGLTVANAQVPTGAVNGLFSVGANTLVFFSQGNLQYKASTNKWQFAPNQYEYIGSDNANISQTYSGWIDLFGWGTSSYNHGAICYQPWSTSQTNGDYYAYGNEAYNLFDQSGQADWGYNAISNGGNKENSGWRTLTNGEWNYLFNTRTTSSGIRYAKATVNGVNGVILLPDDWDANYYTLNSPNGGNYTSNTITAGQWVILEQHGAVFLPAAGYRDGTSVIDAGIYGTFWSASYGSNDYAYVVYFYDGYLNACSNSGRHCGLSVRLVRSVENCSFTIHATPNPAEGGAVSGAGAYLAGSECTLTATASAGYTFAYWTENGRIVSEDAIYTFMVGYNRNLVAHFASNGCEGLLNGQFSVGENTMVFFSQGNLQYRASTNKWKFATNQYDYIGSDNANISQTYAGWIDLFGWGTSGYNHGAHCYQPWSTSTNYDDYYAYGNEAYNLFDQSGQADWGYNAISNGGNQVNSGWRTLTKDEWAYLFNTRATSSGIRYAKATVNDVIGVILLPDDWNADYYSLSNTNTSGAGFSTNVITATQWVTLEQHGAVFLPAAGSRFGAFVGNVGSSGYYWSASYSATNLAWSVYFGSSYLYAGYDGNRCYGRSVRLVRSVENCSINATPTPTEGGAVSGHGAYKRGAECTLTATASAGYTFAYWTENGHVVSEDPAYTFTVGNNRNLLAHFASNGCTGQLNGQFSVGGNTLVYFSQGNLQYRASTSTWRFAESQYVYVGSGNSNISQTYSGLIDLFGWGTSGYNHGANCYQPWSTSTSSSDYYAYGDYRNNLYSVTGQADWGYNAISNGGNTANGGWRTLKNGEWNYLFNTRATSSGIRYAKAMVNGVNGVILLPDDWSADYYTLSDTNIPEASFGSNLITSTQWVTLEQHGAVFLPTAGDRSGTSVYRVGGSGYYWSASYYSTSNTYNVYFDDGELLSADSYGSRRYGQSVRLVRVVRNYSIDATANLTEGGAVSGHGAYGWGASCTLTATASAGYQFVHWTENGTVVSTDAEYTFVVTGDRNLVAQFQPNSLQGVVNGIFSVGNDQQVFFSQGNLQYIGSASTPCWRFADHQWDYIGATSGQQSNNQNVDRDLFGWGTSGYDHGAACYQPWSTSGDNNDYKAYGSLSYNLNDQTGQADWGYNAILNGGNQENIGWRTLTYDEWEYLLNTRSTTSNLRYAMAQVNNVNGVILLPDTWQASYYALSGTNSSGVSFSTNVITASQWTTLEQHGAVFLPAAGARNGTSVNNAGSKGYYSSATTNGTVSAYDMVFHEGGITTNDLSGRHYGLSVRLVIPADVYAINATPNPTEGGSVSGAGTYFVGAACTLTATASANYTFVNWTENGEVVSTDAEYTFTVTGDRTLVANFTPIIYSQVVSLAKGWNWWASTVQCTLEELETTLGTNGLTIMSKDATATYSNGQWTGTLTELALGQMYRIETLSTFTFTLNGTRPASLTITLAPGQNWFGCTSTGTLTIANAFANFTPTEGDKVISQNEGFAIFNGLTWEGTLNTLQPGHGYVYVSKGSTTQTAIFGAPSK